MRWLIFLLASTTCALAQQQQTPTVPAQLGMAIVSYGQCLIAKDQSDQLIADLQKKLKDAEDKLKAEKPNG